MTDNKLPDSAASRWAEYAAGLTSGKSRFLPVPWPQMREVLRLGYRRKVGIVAQRRTREATVGRRIAEFVAREAGHVLLCTAYPPEEHERLHILDKQDLTPDAVNARIESMIKHGMPPALVVIERYERMRFAEPDAETTRGDELMWCGRRVYGQYGDLNVPTVFTTVVDQVPPMERWVRTWAGMDSPANVMTDFCRTVLVVHRLDQQHVRVRTELDSDEYSHPAVNDVEWPYA